MTKRRYTPRQIAKIREELSVDNNGKFRHFLNKLQEKFDPWELGRVVLPANAAYLEDVAKKVKSTISRHSFNFYIDLKQSSKERCSYIDFFDEVLSDYIDVIILRRISISKKHNNTAWITIDFNGIVNDFEEQVKQYLKTL